MKLLIDIGNSRIKWGLADGEGHLQRSGVMEQEVDFRMQLLTVIFSVGPISAYSLLVFRQMQSSADSM